MSGNERLPQELKDAILHQLYSAGDIQSLATCTLAHRSLYPTAQDYLFRDVLLHNSLVASRLHRSLKGNPRLIAYIRVLRIEESVQGWIVSSRELPGILNDVHAAQEFHFHMTPVAYDELPRQLRDALSRMIALPSMRTLSLTHVVGLPQSVIGRVSRLRDLRLTYVSINGSEDGNDHSSPPLQLLDFTVHGSGQFFENIARYLRHGGRHLFKVDGLRFLSLITYGTQWQTGIPDVITPCANTLQSLELGCSVSADNPFDTELPKPLPRLKLLALRAVKIICHDTRAWIWLSRLIARAPNVAHVAVEVQCPVPRLFILARLIFRLANVLVGDHGLHGLKSFRVIASSSRHSSFEYDREDLEEMEWALDMFRTNNVDVKIERVVDCGLAISPLLSVDLLDE